MKKKLKKCKFCETLFLPFNTTQVVCNYHCAQLYAEEKRKKEEQKKWNIEKKKRIEDLMTLQEWLAKAQKEFNKFIRLRDKGELCISCKRKPLKENAGHYYNVHQHYNVRFDERNVHLQCEYCNTYLHANLIYYEENLIKKIGIEEFEKLKSIAKITRNFTIPEVKEIFETYKEKNKLLKKY